MEAEKQSEIAHEIRVPSHRLYLDESGDHRYDNVEVISSGYLTLLGCIFEREKDYLELNSKMNALKNKYWPNADPDKPVIFHREDMVRKRGYFNVFEESEILESFNRDLLDLLSSAPYAVINVTLDKATHLKRYKYPNHPYEYCVHVMLERYVFWLNEMRKQGDVLAESRGKEDLHLKRVYRSIWQDGTLFKKAEFFQKALTSKEIKIKPKLNNIAGLQIADMLAYPLREKLFYEKGIRRHNFKGRFSELVYESVASKIRRGEKGKLKGFGEIFIS